MKKVLILGTIVVVGILGVCYSVETIYSGEINERSNLNIILEGLKKRDCWFEDYYIPVRTFYQIIKNNQWVEIDQRKREEIKVAFFDLLELLKQSGTEKVEGEDGSRCIFQLYYIAGELKDQRAIPFLIKELSYNGAQEALVKIGKPAIESVTEALYSDNSWVRRGAIQVLEIWLSGGVLIERYDVLGTRSIIASPSIPAVYIGNIYDVSTQTTQVQEAPSPKIGKIELNEKRNAQIKNLLIEKLNDESPDVREGTVQVLGNLGDTSVIPFIKSLAENDSYFWETDASFRHGKKGEKIIIYPVREEAQRVLKLLEEKKKEKELKNQETEELKTKELKEKGE
ncbi:MAG: HEAT repeat domain-containing protein [bacterium]|nr:HEAT repeat domain-containing protein [bacterium]